MAISNYLKESIKELNAMTELFNIDDCTHCAINEWMIKLAPTSEHMKITEFADMCKDLVEAGEYA